MSHHTKDKGDLAAVLVIADLTKKGYTCFTPVVSEHLPFDVIAYKDNKCYRIQSKYSSDSLIKNKTSWSDKNGTHTKKYDNSDFDYYGVYLSEVDAVVYPSIKFGGITIRHDVPNSAAEFWWYKDFLDLTDSAAKKSYKDFGVEITTGGKGKSRVKCRKVVRPSKEELEKLIWEKPTVQLAAQFGVSDKAIEKWCKYYGIEKPKRGYWNSVNQNHSN